MKIYTLGLSQDFLPTELASPAISAMRQFCHSLQVPGESRDEKAAWSMRFLLM